MKHKKRMGPKEDFIKNTIATKAVDLKPFLDKIRDATTLDLKKQYAIEMSVHFKVGGVESFVENVNKATTILQIDQLAYYAALKGHGMGAKLY